MSAESDRSIRVTMVSPSRAECGVSDYTKYLTDELKARVDLLGVVDPTDYRGATDGADIVHIQHQYFFFGGIAPWKNRFRSFARTLTTAAVMTVHEFVEPAGPPHVRAAIRITNRFQFRHPRIRRLIVHTAFDRLRMAASGFDGGRIEVIRHGVPPRPALPSKGDAKRSVGLEGRFVLTLFGFLSRRKGHGIAIEAMRDLPSDAILLLAGGRHPDDRSDYAVMIEKMIAAENLSGQVRTMGYLQPADVAAVMAATDLVVAPFTETSGSGSLALAFACGKPVLVSDIAPHHEFEDGAARIVRNDPSEWANSIRSVMGSAEAINDMAVQAEMYAQKHTYGRMADETAALYRRVLQE